MYRRIVFGATYCGCGIAIAHDETLVVESGGLIGRDFADALCEREGDFSVNTDAGRCFFEALSKRGLIKGNAMYLGASVYVLADMLKKKDVNILFNTQVLEVEKKDGFYSVEVYGANGFETLEANEVIDTTATGILPGRTDTDRVKKSLNAIVSDGGYVNPVSGLHTYTLPIDIDTDWREAREIMCENAKDIIHIANSFSYSLPFTKETLPDGTLWLASAGFETAVKALDGGAMYETL